MLRSVRNTSPLTLNEASYTKPEQEVLARPPHARDLQAKEEYFNTTRNAKVDKDDLFVMDIIRQEVKNDDPRIQRNILK